MASNYFNQLSSGSFQNIERAILLEEIKLPIYNEKSKFTLGFFGRIIEGLSYFDCNKEYKFAYNELKDIKAKFSIPSLTPLSDNKEASDKQKITPRSVGFKGNNNSVASSYITSNYIELTIPKYILLEFVDLQANCIPKGTEFLICCPGGQLYIEDIRIIGIFTLNYSDNSKFKNYRDASYGGINKYD